MNLPVGWDFNSITSIGDVLVVPSGSRPEIRTASFVSFQSNCRMNLLHDSLMFARLASRRSLRALFLTLCMVESDGTASLPRLNVLAYAQVARRQCCVGPIGVSLEQGDEVKGSDKVTHVDS